jgi:hypothetical protein
MTASHLLPSRVLLNALLAGPAFVLAGCGELGFRNDPPQQIVADSLSDTTLAVAEPARPKARPAPPSRRSYPSAEEVMYGPPAPRDTAPRGAAPVQPRTYPGAQPRADLERLVRAQEQHWANTGLYASRFQNLPIRYVPNAGVDVIIESATDSGWIGRAVRSGWEGRSCVVWVGRPDGQPTTERQGLRAPRSGVPVCDSL